MADPVSLTLGAIVAALVVKAAEQAGESGAEAAVGVLGRVASKVRSWFGSVGDEQATAALARAEDPPVGEAQLSKLAAAIDVQAGRPEAQQWVVELKEIIAAGEQSDGVDVDQVVQTVWGNQNVSIGQSVNSVITINQPPASNG